MRDLAEEEINSERTNFRFAKRWMKFHCRKEEEEFFKRNYFKFALAPAETRRLFAMIR